MEAGGVAPLECTRSSMPRPGVGGFRGGFKPLNPLSAAICNAAAVEWGIPARGGKGGRRECPPARKFDKGEVKYSLLKASKPARPMGGGSLGRLVGVRKSRVSLVLLLSFEPGGLRPDISKPSLCALSSFSISSRSSRS